jgi:hypothetical protein
MAAVLDVISGVTIAVGVFGATYFLHLIRRRELTSAKRRNAWRGFGFCVFAICLNLVLQVGQQQQWPLAARWSIDAVAAAIVLSNLGLLIRQHVRS